MPKVFSVLLRSFNPSLAHFSSILHKMNKNKKPKKSTKSPIPLRISKKSFTCKVKSRSKDSKPSSSFQESDSLIATTSESTVSLEQWPILDRDFYQIDALDLAPRLLGKHLKKDDVVLRITEVEAYRTNDTACHGRFGITPRTAPVFGPGGHAYIYLCYGLHNMINVVADKEGNGAAVLIRSCSPISGLATIQQRRGLQTEKPILLTGPGKVGQALGISTEWSSQPLFTSGGLELIDGPEPESILAGPRVGIEYASPEHVSAPWRFALAGSQWISAPRNTLRPL